MVLGDRHIDQYVGIEHVLVVRRIDHDGHGAVVLGGAAEHRRPADVDLLDRLVDHLPPTEELQGEEPIQLAIIGRPNVGKSSLLKIKGTEIQQRIQKLTVDAAGIYAAAWGGAGAGPKFARSGMSGYLSSRAYTIYGGASEVQKDVIAKNVLGIKRSAT